MIPAATALAGTDMVPASLQELADRGVPTQYSGAALAKIGMPVGGITCGQVYLSGDGRLWVWDIFNQSLYAPGCPDCEGSHYFTPLNAGTYTANPPLKNGFVLRTDAGGTVKTRALDSTGFTDVKFTGSYPIGTVDFKAADSPVEVKLEAFSPFIPLATDDSSYPAIVMSYTLKNTSTGSVRATIGGYAENPVCRFTASQQVTRLRSTAVSQGQARYVDFGAADAAEPRPDIVFEDWERDTYAPWTTTGNAFGPGPVVAANVPDGMKRFDGPAQHHLNSTGTRLVTSHNFRLTGDPDAYTGTLVSPDFTVSRKFVTISLGGGDHAGTTCARVVVDGQIVATATGNNDERVTARVLDVSAHQGKTARIEIVDQLTGPWAHLNVDLIVFSDREDVVIEDWEQADFSGWTSTGTAFGAGPVTADDVAKAPALFRRFGDLNVTGRHFVTSYNWRTPGDPDGHTGSLTSAPFRITRRYLSVSVGGGSHVGKTCVDVLVDGVVVASATGRDTEPLEVQTLDVGAFEGRTAQIRINDQQQGTWAHISCGAIHLTDEADILFEDWPGASFAPWTVTGTAFGPGPVTPAETPEDFRRPFGEITELNVSGPRFVTSLNWRVGNADAPVGTLTSPEFTVSRQFVTAWVGGGGYPHQTAVQILVGSQVVASCHGKEMEPMQAVSMDVGRFRGQQARIRIIDDQTGAWGHVNCDRIVFSNRPVRSQKVADRLDGGGFALAALDPTAMVRPSIADWSTPAAVLDSAAGPAEVEGGVPQAGAVSASVTLAPGESKTLRFVFGWFFPKVATSVLYGLQGGSSLQRHYSTRFSSSRAVIDSLAAAADRLETQTRSWVQTFYQDSTLPYWFCERTLANASTLATSTCHRFSNGRFYAYEGRYSCYGTCQHVWNYAQSVARLFPDLERDTRERVDLGLALRANGEMQNRGEFENSFIDGQCGTILRIYREHQMSTDAGFLGRVWPKVRLAVDFVVNNRDVDSDGVIEGAQWNTLDSEWWGEVPWISGLYVAALRAAAAMATEVGDTTSASKYAGLADRGTAFINSTLWNSTYGYYVQRKDPNHAANMNSNRGLFIDQMYGQTYASQLGLPRVFPADKAKVALGNLYRKNFLPDSSNYSRFSGIPGGRIYSTAGEAGMVMCTWPNGGANQSGTIGLLLYFNEVWTGQEHQVAAHLMSEGMVAESLAITRAVHDRYSGNKRNPYNEIECGDHYARGMMSHAVFLAACGYEHHGPKAHLGFAPQVTPEDFRAAFTTADGWGSYRQTRSGNTQSATVEVRYGQVKVATFSQKTAATARSVTVKVAGTTVPATVAVNADRAVVTLATPAVIQTGQKLEVALS